MRLERGRYGGLPYAALGAGPPLVLLPGLGPVRGVGGDGYARACLGPVLALAEGRRLVVLGRREGLPRGIDMGGLAAEHAAALRDAFDGPVDVVGVSTGGSIAQQLAADQPDVVRRLVLGSTACRLGSEAKTAQATVARLITSGRTRDAMGVLAAELVPLAAARSAARGLGWLFGPTVLRDPVALADMVATIQAEDGFDLAACASPVRAPTLLVWGERDRFYPADLVEETARLIPGARLSRFPGKGHVGVLSDRGCRATIAGFLTSVT